MKKFILFAVILLMGSDPCFARLGETAAKLERRFGRPVGQPVKKDGTVVRKYWNNPFNASIAFKNDKAVVISFKLRNGEKMSVKRINRLLRENGARTDSAGAEGYVEFSTWYFKRFKNKGAVVEFVDKPGRTYATYSLKNNVLVIKHLSRR